MSPADLAALKSRIESALAESVKEFGGGTVPSPRLAKLAMPLDRAWALVNADDARAILTDNAVRAMGGTAFTVTVDDAGITIEPAAKPAAPVATPPATPATPTT